MTVPLSSTSSIWALIGTGVLGLNATLTSQEVPSTTKLQSLLLVKFAASAPTMLTAETLRSAPVRFSNFTDCEGVEPWWMPWVPKSSCVGFGVRSPAAAAKEGAASSPKAPIRQARMR